MDFSNDTRLQFILGGALVFLIALAVLPTVFQQFNQVKMTANADGHCTYLGERFTNVSTDWDAPGGPANLRALAPGEVNQGNADCVFSGNLSTAAATYFTPQGLELNMPRRADLYIGGPGVAAVANGRSVISNTTWDVRSENCYLTALPEVRFRHIAQVSTGGPYDPAETHAVVADPGGTGCAALAVPLSGTAAIDTTARAVTYVMPAFGERTESRTVPAVVADQQKLNDTIIELLPLVLIVAGLLAAGTWIYNARGRAMS